MSKQTSNKFSPEVRSRAVGWSPIRRPSTDHVGRRSCPLHRRADGCNNCRTKGSSRAPPPNPNQRQCYLCWNQKLLKVLRVRA